MTPRKTHLAHALAVAFVTAGIVFLLAAFANASFEITQWTSDARAITALLMGACGVIGGVFTMTALEVYR